MMLKGDTLLFVVALLVLFGLLFWKSRAENFTKNVKKSPPPAKTPAPKRAKPLNDALISKIKLAKAGRLTTVQYLNVARRLGYSKELATQYLNNYSSE